MIRGNACGYRVSVSPAAFEGPFSLRFRPEAIACGPSSNSSTCLTLDQIAALRGLYTDWYSQNGTFLFSGWDVGGELAYGGPYSYASGPDIPIGPEYYKYFIFGYVKGIMEATRN